MFQFLHPENTDASIFDSKEDNPNSPLSHAANTRNVDILILALEGDRGNERAE